MIQELSLKVDNLVPQTNLQPFSKPSQKAVGRDINVASWFRMKTTSENKKLPSNATRKYLEFPDDVSDEQLNEDMKRCIHGILCGRLRPGWETKSWNAIYSLDKRLGEQVIKEASLRPEMAVIAQSAGYWAIRTIAEQRQKSTKRAAEQRNARTKRDTNATKKKGNCSTVIDQVEPDAIVKENDQKGVTTHLINEIKTNRNATTNNSYKKAIAPIAEEAVAVVKDIEEISIESESDGSVEHVHEDTIEPSDEGRKELDGTLANRISPTGISPEKLKVMFQILEPEQIQQLFPEMTKTSRGPSRERDDESTIVGLEESGSGPILLSGNEDNQTSKRTKVQKAVAKTDGSASNKSRNTRSKKRVRGQRQ